MHKEPNIADALADILTPEYVRKIAKLTIAAQVTQPKYMPNGAFVTSDALSESGALNLMFISTNVKSSARMIAKQIPI